MSVSRKQSLKNHACLEVTPKSETNSFPRAMQVLTYKCPGDVQKRKQLEKHRARHQRYIRKYLAQADSKLNLHLMQSMDELEKTRGFQVHLSFYFDQATEEDLKAFAQNDPWIQHQLVEHWDCNFDTLVFDPIQMAENQEKGPFTFQF